VADFDYSDRRKETQVVNFRDRFASDWLEMPNLKMFVATPINRNRAVLLIL
jgi:hypothetical protein